MRPRRHPRKRGGSHNPPYSCQVWWLPAREPMIAAFGIALAAVFLLASWSTGRAQTSEVAFDLRIERGQVAANMRLIRVRQGDAVKLRWTTDRPIALHLHGYDIEVKVEPGAIAEMAFTARATGRFPVEEHQSNAKVGHSHGEVPLARVEVRPR